MSTFSNYYVVTMSGCSTSKSIASTEKTPNNHWFIFRTNPSNIAPFCVKSDLFVKDSPIDLWGKVTGLVSKSWTEKKVHKVMKTAGSLLAGQMTQQPSIKDTLIT